MKLILRLILILIFVTSCKAQDGLFKPTAYEIRAKVVRFEKIGDADYAIFEFIKTSNISYFFRLKNDGDYHKWEEWYLILITEDISNGVINAKKLHSQLSIRQSRYDKEEGRRVLSESYNILEYVLSDN